MLNEKNILYDEMVSHVTQLINKNNLMISTEEEIVRIKYEIDISKLEMQ